MRSPTKTELVWDGKYDKNGQRVAPLRVALPFQTVETVNESTQERQRNLLAQLDGRIDAPEWRNRLIWGDKKYVLPSLLPEFAGKVNLIYIDPPFDTGADFSFTATIPDHPDTPEDESFAFTKAPSIIEQKAYRDTWGRGLDSYLQWFYETVVLLHELLHETGSLYVHLDWHVLHYAKAILDEVFGTGLFVNEIIWRRTNVHSHAAQGTQHFARIQDTILFFSKTESHTWHQLYSPHSPQHMERSYKYVEEKTGRRYSLGDLTVTDGGPKGNPRFEFLGVTRFWRYNKDKMDELLRQGSIVQASPDAVPRQKRYLDESPGVEVSSLWADIPPVPAQSSERLDYATQKPEALLERIIKASSNEGDLVLDCFVGSGTTTAVAEKLNRRWIACDLGRFAIHTTRKRLLAIPNVRPFVVQNLGKYERQLWQVGEFGNGKPGEESSAEAALKQANYVGFILKLYDAKPIHGHTYLHGVKSGRMVHVGSVDAPVSVGDVTNIAAEFRQAIGTGKDAPKTNGVDVLGWDFAFELNEVALQQAASANIQMKFLRIPRDVMDKRAVEQGDVKFFELASLSVKTEVKSRNAALRLTDFVIPPDDVPEDARKAVTHWSQWIDYWAVDWDFKGDTFHNQWQTCRTRKDPKIALETSHAFDAPGELTVVVKVIDILGNDTTKSVRVRVK